MAAGKGSERRGKWCTLKIILVVTQEGVDEYESVGSAVNGRVVEEKVCNELKRIRLIEFNAIGFDFIELNPISFNQIEFNLISHCCCQGTGSITRGMVAIMML